MQPDQADHGMEANPLNAALKATQETYRNKMAELCLQSWEEAEFVGHHGAPLQLALETGSYMGQSLPIWTSPKPLTSTVRDCTTSHTAWQLNMGADTTTQSQNDHGPTSPSPSGGTDGKQEGGEEKWAAKVNPSTFIVEKSGKEGVFEITPLPMRKEEKTVLGSESDGPEMGSTPKRDTASRARVATTAMTTVGVGKERPDEENAREKKTQAMQTPPKENPSDAPNKASTGRKDRKTPCEEPPTLGLEDYHPAILPPTEGD